MTDRDAADEAVMRPADHPRSEPFDEARPFVAPPTLRRVNGTAASEDPTPPDVTDLSPPMSELD